MNKTIALPNGLTLITAPIDGAKTTAVLLLVATGSKYESRTQNGLSHFLEHMFFKGTRHRPSALILSSELDALGAEYNAFTSKEYTGYWIKAAAEQAPTALEIVGDMLSDPLLAEEEINREKGVIIEELNMYLDNPRWHIEDVWEALLYGDTPAGWYTIGTKDNIKSWTRADFLDYYQKQYGAASSLLLVAGRIPDNIETLTRQHFSALKPNPWENKQAVSEAQSAPAVKLEVKTTDQAHLALGVRTKAYGHPDEYILKIISLILGGSMSSRLFINLRERNGLAYYVSTSLESYTDSGYLVTNAGVPLDKLETAINIILNEYKRLKTELVSDTELNKVKSMFAGKLLLGLEGADDVAQWYGRQLILLKQQAKTDQSALTPEEFTAKIKAVSTADIKRVAEEIFTQPQLNLALISPHQDANKLLPLLKL
jgi:predicted Zn-dependent peptidase